MTLEKAVFVSMLVAAGTMAASQAAAQAPAGPEFMVNTYTTDWQAYAAVAADPDSNFVVVWTTPNGTGSMSVAAQLFDGSGVPRGAEFRVNAFTSGWSRWPKVATDGTGAFTVAWAEDPAFTYNIYVRRFDSAGVPRGVDLLVNTHASTDKFVPSLAVSPAGNSVVVWASEDQDGDGWGVFGQLLNADGTPRGAEFRVNSGTTGSQFWNSVAMDAAGNFVVVWDSDFAPPGMSAIYGRRYAASGAPLGSPFRVNAQTTGRHEAPVVAAAATGEFVVAWTAASRIGVRRFDAAGTPQGPEMAADRDFGSFPAAAMNAAGSFMVTWGTPGAGAWTIEGRRFDASGTPLGPPLRLSPSTLNDRYSPVIAMAPDGHVLAAWYSNQPERFAYDVFAQRVGLIGPSAMEIDAAPGGGSDGNRVFDPGEAVDVRPSWRNSGGSSASLMGTVTNFTGPDGGIYIISDGVGAYGTVAPGGTQACLDCYRMFVPEGARPTQHWDAVLAETINPDDDGHFEWNLHLGGSFFDVPRASPFYLHVETLLHHGVTAGCGDGRYCPGSSTTREQMAPFVLSAKEGPGHLPPACTTPVFGDVPASSPFCPWIEELARRGVTGGCGGGNYCPSAVVSREQMAVFVLRTLDPALDPPACAPPNTFNDVPETSAFCRWIEELARRGIASGCGGGNYCPTAAVTREQMAVFLTGTFGLTLYGP